MSETRTATAEDEAPVEGASVVVEATTAEAAIAEVHDTYGPDARIVEARRVLRGGIGGFFAKEHVQLHVAADQRGAGAPGASRRRPVSADPDIAARAVALAEELTARPVASPAESPVDRLLAGEDEGEAPAAERDADGLTAADGMDFQTYLRAQLAAERASALPAEAEPMIDPAGGEEATDDAVFRDVGGPRPARWPGISDPWAAVAASAADELATPEPATAASSPAPDATAPSAPVHPVPSTTATVTDATVTDATVTAATVADHGPAWSITRLLHLGVPASLVHALEIDADADDLAWLGALTDALRPLCRPLPQGDGVLVGPRASTLSPVVDAPVARSRTWLAALGGQRWRHLVVGGDGWRDQLADEPLAVSWTRAEDLPDALRCASELGLVLGYGPRADGLHRARPLDVALAVREMVDAR